MQYIAANWAVLGAGPQSVGYYPISTVVEACSFNGSSCNLGTDFVQKNDTYYGACYAFNTNSAYYSSRSGPLYGVLRLCSSFLGHFTHYLPLCRIAFVAACTTKSLPAVDPFGRPSHCNQFAVRLALYKRLGLRRAGWHDNIACNSNGESAQFSIEISFPVLRHTTFSVVSRFKPNGSRIHMEIAHRQVFLRLIRRLCIRTRP